MTTVAIAEGIKNQTLEIALFYAARGWHVIPLAARTKDAPLIKWRAECSADEEQIKEWWTKWPDANIAIATGESGLLVVDIDPDKGGTESWLALVYGFGQIPPTVEQITGSGGRHILFKAPGVEIGNKVGNLGPGLDIRGVGGYIVAPPSVHPNGTRYEWELSSLPSKTEIADPPKWLIQLLTTDMEDYSNGNKVDYKVPANIIEGSRNQFLTSLAGTMRKRGMSADAMFAALSVENEAHCNPPLSTDEIMKISKSVSRYKPDVIHDFPEPELVKTKKPMDAFEGIVSFLELLDNLEGRSIKTYLAKLDSALGGLERQTLTVLASRPSMGKTTLAWQIARNVAASGLRSYFFSLEMSVNSLWAKAACGAVGIRWRDVRSGNVTDAERERVIDAAVKMQGVYEDRLLVNDHVNTTQNIWESVATYRPDLIVVDHLRLVNDVNDSEVRRLGEITKRLKDMSKEFNSVVLCLAQLNRSVEHREKKRPHMADLRDSGQIEENADTILMIYRPDYYDDEKTVQRFSESEVLVRKFRDDINNQRITIPFDTAYQWFGEEAYADGREYK